MPAKLFLAFLATAATVSIAAVIALTPGEFGTLNCLGDVLTITQTTTTSADYNCLAYTPTPAPTPTDVPPTSTPPSGPVAPYADAPACATHDPRAYHGIWNAQQGCHYDHTHGDNPHEVDDIFGTGFYATAGGEISYPWQTDGENHEHHKHEGYKWLVRRDLPCDNNNAAGCIRAFRAQPHADLHNVASEYHSYAIEALVCPDRVRDDNCGIIRFGG